MFDPAAYAANNYAQRKDTTQLLNEYSHELKNMSGLCMDIGCGTGDVTNDILLPKLHPDATIAGTDFSESMLKYATERYRSEKRITFDYMDIQTENLPIKYISGFDHIFSFYTLQWCSEIRKALQNMHTMLRPQGTILFNMVCKHDVYDVIRHFSKDHRYSQYFKLRQSLFQYCADPQGEMEKLLNDVEYRIHHCSVRQITTRYESLDKLISMFMSVAKFFLDIPAQLKQKFKEDFTREYMKIFKQKSRNPENTIWLDNYTLLVVYAFKNA